MKMHFKKKRKISSPDFQKYVLTSKGLLLPSNNSPPLSPPPSLPPNQAKPSSSSSSSSLLSCFGFFSLFFLSDPGMLIWGSSRQMSLHGNVTPGGGARVTAYVVAVQQDFANWDPTNMKKKLKRLLPNHQRWHAKMEAQSEYVCVASIFLHVWHRLVCSVGDE